MSSVNAPLLQQEDTNKTPIVSCALLLANGAIGIVCS